MINRNNYEEFFLLYVDGELKQADRAQVEEFVQQNPDLAEELEMLQQAILLPESMAFDNKESLYRAESGINKNNYEEYFLLAVDNELTKEESSSVEKFVLQHPALQEEYTLLHQTKLPAEEVVFPNKEDLYRTEKQRRVIPITWLRMSAAAAVIVLIAATWITQFNTSVETSAEVVAINKPVIENVAPNQTTQPQNKIPAVAEQIVNVSAEKNQSEAAKQAGIQKEKISVPAKNEVAVREKKIKPFVPAAEQRAPKLLPPTEEMMAAIIKKPGEKTSLPVNVVAKKNEAGNDNLVAATTNENDLAENKSIIRQAVYKDFEEDEESKTIYLGVAEINRNKLKSIFKKASSLFERKEKSNDDDDRTINIASFKFKSK